MADHPELQLQHHTFAKEAFAYLLHKCRDGKKCVTESEFFQPEVGDAILVLSYIIRKRRWKSLNQIREDLEEVSYFEKFCSFARVEKDERYFYNFLRRMSIIFDLTMYCVDEGLEYFNTGLKCAANYTDIQYFESSGGWKKLHHAAQYIASLGRPLTLIMSKENLPSGKNIESFPVVVEEVRNKFLRESNSEVLESKAMLCITKISEECIKQMSLKPPKEEDTTLFNLVKSNPEIEMKIAIRTYFRHCYLSLAVLLVTPQNLTSPDQDVSLIREECPPAEDQSETECMQENPSERKTTKFADADQDSKNDEINKKFREIFNKKLVDREECLNPLTLITRLQHLDLSEDSGSIKWNSKICPPSLGGNFHRCLKEILDKSSKSLNRNIIPSEDILVCPPSLPSKNEETTVIFPGSSTDDNEDPDIDIPIPPFEKIQIDSQVEETGYSLRSRGVAEKRPSSEMEEEVISVMMGMAASTSGRPSKIPRRRPPKSSETIPHVAMYAEELIGFYESFFPSFLDLYFQTDFPTVETGIQSLKSSESNVDSCEYVFAVSARIMARRKELLGNPDESKPVMGIRLYKDFSVGILPLPAQQFLDSQIEKNNYFEVADGIYGVGPKGPAVSENVWAILYSADGTSNSLGLNERKVDEMPEILRSYEPVLEIFFSAASYFTAIDSSLLVLLLHRIRVDLILQNQKMIKQGTVFRCTKY